MSRNGTVVAAQDASSLASSLQPQTKEREKERRRDNGESCPAFRSQHSQALRGLWLVYLRNGKDPAHEWERWSGALYPDLVAVLVG